MKQVTGYIVVGKYKFLGFHSVRIESSWENFTDRASLSISRVSRLKTRTQESYTLMKRGDKVEIWLGFNHINEKKFTGYITSITPRSDMVQIECEDEMYQLKKNPITKSYKSVSLSQLLRDIQPYPVDAENVELGRFRINHATPIKVLEELRNQYGFYSWFRDGVLYSGFAYKPELSKRHVFQFGANILDDDTLTYSDNEAIPIQVHAVSVQRDNTRIEIDYPKEVEEADKRTLYVYNVGEAALQVAAKAFAEKARYNGFTGGFQSFGGDCRHGDVAVLQDPLHQDRNGAYLIRAVTTTSGVNGYFMDIQLHQRVK